MKYTLTINQKQALELGLNFQQAVILGLICDSHSWAETEIIDGKVYYWTARQKIAEELEILNLKPDSVYRHLKSLEKLGLIDYIKSGKKDCVKLTEKGKTYYVGNKSENDEIYYVGNKSEKDENSEINPTKLGNKSEFNSEINPTYKNTNLIRATKDKYSKELQKEILDKSETYPSVNLDALAEWIEFKPAYKKIAAVTKTLNFLSKYNFNTQQEIIDMSIRNNYQGLFEPKSNQSYKQQDAYRKNNIIDTFIDNNFNLHEHLGRNEDVVESEVITHG